MGNDKQGSDNQGGNCHENGKIFGLILAAGYSSRMGSFKPLLPIGDMTAMQRVIGTLKTAGVENIIGVTGFQREQLSSIFAREGIIEAYNQDFGQGMFTSIQTGIRKALSETQIKPDGFFLMLVDCPLVDPQVLKFILQKQKEDPEAFITPCYRGKKGHPLFIPIQYAEEILAYKGEGGLKAITNLHEDRLIRLEVDTESVVLDMDTPEGYEEILKYYREQSERKKLKNSQAAEAITGQAEEPDFDKELQGKRIFFIRHGEIRQHREKIFLGQRDIPLSERGKEQAKEAAVELEKYHVTANRIYTSDLSRTTQTAEIIIDSLKPFRDMTLIKEPKLREMSLGEWDGRYIREIKEQYPEEYKKRGEDLLAYKYGNESENFYDLRYRALKGFRSILDQEAEAGDGAKDILIVTHWGVINVLLSNLHHAELKEEVKKPVPNGGIIIMDYI